MQTAGDCAEQIYVRRKMTGEMKSERKPDFLHIGPQRCGTTSLYQALNGLGCVPHEVKEIQFFDRHYDLGLIWYFEHFSNLSSGNPVGEVCPTYFSSQEAIDRIKDALPQVRIACTLRSPLSRIPSYYRLLRMYNQCEEGIERAWNTCSELRSCCMYSGVLANWYDSFGSEKILVLLFDELKRNPSEFFFRFASHVGLRYPTGWVPVIPGPEKEPIPRFPVLNEWASKIGFAMRRRKLYGLLESVRRIVRPVIYHVGVPIHKIELSYAFKRMVCEYYRNELTELEEIVGRDLTSWKTP